MRNLMVYCTDNKEVELFPMVFDENGNVVAWWSDNFNTKLMNHPKVIEEYEKTNENLTNELYASFSTKYNSPDSIENLY